MTSAQFIHFAHLVDEANHKWIAPILVVIALASWLAAVASFFLAKRKSGQALKSNPVGFMRAAVIFSSVVISGILISIFCQEAAFQDIKPRIFARIEAADTDAGPISNIAVFAADLRTLHGEMGHHSHPLRAHSLFLQTDKGPLTLTVARDSSEIREYWVWNPAFHSADMGRFYTATLDALR